jgi:hypothetical protein
MTMITKINIRHQILTGNLGDGWVDVNKAGQAFAQFMRHSLVSTALERYPEATVCVDIDVKRNCSGYSRGLVADAYGADGMPEADLSDEFAEVAHECWAAFCESEMAKDLIE